MTTLDPRQLPAHCLARQSPDTLRKLGLSPEPDGKAAPAMLARRRLVLALVVEAPIRVASVANVREHWSTKSKRNRAQRTELGDLLGPERPPLPVAVHFTRIGPRDLDLDNLQSAFKALRDEVADWLGVDDGPTDPVTWLYCQERGPVGVRVRITSNSGPARGEG